MAFGWPARSHDGAFGTSQVQPLRSTSNTRAVPTIRARSPGSGPAAIRVARRLGTVTASRVRPSDSVDVRSVAGSPLTSVARVLTLLSVVSSKATNLAESMSSTLTIVIVGGSIQPQAGPAPPVT